MAELTLGDRGVSEVLGYVLLFSIVIVSISVASIFGTGALQDGRDVATVENVEQGFEGLAIGSQDIMQNDASSRLVRLNPGQGQIEAGEAVHINVSVGGATVVNATTKPIVYSMEQSRIVFVGTAVLRVEDDASAVVRRPDIRVTNEAAIIPVMNLTAIDGHSVAGRTRIDLQRIDSTTHVGRDDDGVEVVVRIDTTSQARATAWQDALSDMLPPDDPCQRTGSRLKCEFDSDAVLVNDVTVEYTLST